MIREAPVMLLLRALAGLALGPSLLAASIGAGPSPLSAVAQIVQPAPRRAEVAVSFDPAGRIAGAALVRSSGSSSSDASAKESALQLASLEPVEQAAGRTRVFRIALAVP
jgi:hypothetical protein